MNLTLLILAAGMGSRYGSLKQIEAFGPSGETITDYSVFDAIKAGFNKVVFVISPAMEEEFVSTYVKKFKGEIDIDYVIQSLDKIPAGIEVHPDRVKPWGTAHAVLMAAEKINEPFAVINADDFYGQKSYQMVADYMRTVSEGEFCEFCLAGYRVENTLSPYGSVSRGVCKVDANGFLTDIKERTKIEREQGPIMYTGEDGSREEITEGTLVSMNLFGFMPSLFDYMENYFKDFIQRNANEIKAEAYLPVVVDEMIKSGRARVKVIETPESWFGVTYKEDRPHVKQMITQLVKSGTYPSKLY